MNELIKKFAISSHIASEYNGELVSPYVQPCDMSEEVQEFAELLIAECLSIVIRSGADSRKDGWWLDKFEEHFGVKE